MAVLILPLVALAVVLMGIFAYQRDEDRSEQQRLDAYWRQFIDDAVSRQRMIDAGLDKQGGFTLEDTGTWAALGDPHGCIEVERLLRDEPSFFDGFRLSDEVATEYFHRLC